MSSAAPAAATPVTHTVFTPSLDPLEPPLSPSDYEHRFLETIAEAIKSFPTSGPDVPEEIVGDLEKARRYFGIEKASHSFFAKVFPSCMMNVAARCPFHEVRKEMIEDVYDEEVTDPDARGMYHIDVLYHDAAVLGISREEVEAMEPSVVMMACLHSLNNLTLTLPWQGGYAATGGLEAVASRREEFYRSQRDEEIERLCGLPEGSLLNGRLHSMKDEQHGGDALQILKKYSTDRQTQELTFWAVRFSRQLRVLYHREQRRLARAAVGLPATSLQVA